MEEILLPPEYLYEQLMKRKAELARCQRERDVLAEALKDLYEEICETEHQENRGFISEKTWLKAKAALAMSDDENKS